MHVVSLAWGILAILSLGLGFYSVFPRAAPGSIIFAAFGFIVSIVGLYIKRGGRRKWFLAGALLCALAVVIGMFRLELGRGIFAG